MTRRRLALRGEGMLNCLNCLVVTTVLIVQAMVLAVVLVGHTKVICIEYIIA